MDEAKPIREVVWRSASEDNMSVVGRKEKKVSSIHGQCLLQGNRQSGIASKFHGVLQRFRVRHGLSCVNGPFWPVRASYYSGTALSLPHSKPLYVVDGRLLPATLFLAGM